MRRKLKRAVSSSRWKMWINVRRTAQYVAVRSSFNSEHQTSWLTRGRGEPARIVASGHANSLTSQPMPNA